MTTFKPTDHSLSTVRLFLNVDKVNAFRLWHGSVDFLKHLAAAVERDWSALSHVRKKLQTQLTASRKSSMLTVRTAALLMYVIDDCCI